MSLINITEVVAIARRLGLSLRVFALLLLLNVLSVLFEVAGIGMLLPVFEMLRHGGSVAVEKNDGWHWDIMRSFSDHTGIPITLGLLLSVSLAFIVLRQIFTYVTTRYTTVVRNEIANKVRQRAFYRFLMADSAMQDQSSVGDIAAILGFELNRTPRCAVFDDAIRRHRPSDRVLFGGSLLAVPAYVLGCPSGSSSASDTSPADRFLRSSRRARR